MELLDKNCIGCIHQDDSYCKLDTDEDSPCFRYDHYTKVEGSKPKYDHYMIHNNVVDRLLREYRLHNRLIVAYDFDNTVFDYHNRGESYELVINLIRKLGKIEGIELIVWTGSDKSRYDFVGDYLKKNDIPFNKINENPDFFKSSSPKIFYSILIDDRAGMESAYNALIDFINKI